MNNRETKGDTWFELECLSFMFSDQHVEQK
jgi:hypothetical protein